MTGYSALKKGWLNREIKAASAEVSGWPTGLTRENYASSLQTFRDKASGAGQESKETAPAPKKVSR